MQVQTAQQRAGQVAVALEAALVQASGRTQDQVHRQLFHTRGGVALLAFVRAAAPAGTEPTGWTGDTSPDAEPVLTPQQGKAFRDLLGQFGLQQDGMARLLQVLETELGVQRLAEVLRENASGNVLEGNSAAASRRTPDERLDAALQHAVRYGDADNASKYLGVAAPPPRDVVLHGTQVQAAPAPAAPTKPKLDVRMFTGRNRTEKVIAWCMKNVPGFASSSWEDQVGHAGNLIRTHEVIA